MPPAHAETLALGGDDGGVVSEAIEQRGGELLVTSEDLGPLAEGEVARDDDRPLLVAVGDEVEEQLAAGAIEGDESDLVEEEEFDAGKTALQAGELALVAGFEEGAHQIGRAPEADVAPLSGGLDAEGDSEVGLAGADRPREDEVLGVGDPAAAVGDLCGVHALGGVEVEGVERLELGEARLAQALAHGRLGAGGDFDGEDLVQVLLVRPVLLAGLAGEALVGAEQARHLERARLALDDLGDDDAAHREPPRSASKSAAAAEGTSTPCRLGGRLSSATVTSRAGCTRARWMGSPRASARATRCAAIFSPCSSRPRSTCAKARAACLGPCSSTSERHADAKGSPNSPTRSSAT